jgi:hypothetical protein
MIPLAEYLAPFAYQSVPLHRGPTGHLPLDGVIGGDLLEAREASIDCKRLPLHLRSVTP